MNSSSAMEANYLSQNGYEFKTRNILSLSERVEVIREFDRHVTRPSLQSLAQRFECSSKQIKNILLNRDSILESYRGAEEGSDNKINKNTADHMQKRQEKIIFLGKVMYEYIQRMLYFNQNIDDHKFKQKALQIKECIAVENFQPTDAWLADFKATYNIPAFNLQALRNNIVINEPKRPHLSAMDMIQFVSRMEQQRSVGQESNRPNNLDQLPKPVTHFNACFNTNRNPSILEPKIVYEIEDDEELQKLNFDDSTPRASLDRNLLHNNSLHSNALQNKSLQNNSIPNSPNQSSGIKKRSASPFPDIESVDEALRHIKVLEEYAMLNDNFRAIGLLTQLEKIFLKKNKVQEEFQQL